VNTGNKAFSKAFAAVVLGAISIASAAIFMRLSDVSPTAAAFWRVTLALPLLYIWLRYDGESRALIGGKLQRTQVFTALGVGLWFAADLYLWHWSVAKTTVANATLLANMAAVFTAVAAFLFFGQRFSRSFLGGLVLALAGAATLIGQNASVSSEYIVGDLLGLATAVAYAGYILVAARARGTLTTPMVMFGSALTTAIVLLPFALIEEGTFFPASFEAWLPLLGLGWFAHVFGQSLIIYGLAHVPATLGSVTLLIQPVISALLAWWLFAEALGLFHLMGALLIFAGIMLARRGSRQNINTARQKPINADE